jgi:hypothetical protein
LVRLAQNVQVHLDDNPDGNAMAPQRMVVTLKDGARHEETIAANLGSIAAPMSAAQSRLKYDLCRHLAGSDADARIFDKPLSYITDPA